MSQAIAVETKKEAVEPLNPAAVSRAIVSGSAPIGTPVSGVVVTRDGLAIQVNGITPLSEEPLTVLDEYIFDGIGGFIAIEDERRGLMKAFGGDTIVTLSDGSRHVIAKEVKDAAPAAPEVLAANKKAREDLAKALETDSEKAAREKAEAELKTGETKKPAETKPLMVEPAKK